MINILFISIIAIFLVTFVIYQANYQKYRNIETKDKTGYDTSLDVTRKYNIDSYIIEKRGNYTDNYNYNKKVIKLSSLVFHDNNAYSAAMGYFIAYQSVLDKENNSLFKIKKLFEPLYYFLIAASYIGIILLALAKLDTKYLIITLGLCLIYQLVFLKTNLDIIKRVKEEFEIDEDISNALDSLYLIDISFGVLYIRVLIDNVIELIKNR